MSCAETQRERFEQARRRRTRLALSPSTLAHCTFASLMLASAESSTCSCARIPNASFSKREARAHVDFGLRGIERDDFERARIRLLRQVEGDTREFVELIRDLFDVVSDKVIQESESDRTLPHSRQVSVDLN